MPVRSDTKTPTKLPNLSGGTVGKISREIRTYTEEYHFERTSEKTRKLYEELKERITALGNDVETVIRKNYIAFRTSHNFVYINLRRSALDVDLSMRAKEMQDPKHVIRNMEGVGHHGAGHSRITIADKTKIPYLMGLIEQSYSKSLR